MLIQKIETFFQNLVKDKKHAIHMTLIHRLLFSAAFKQVYTTRRSSYPVEPGWTISEFIDRMRPLITRDYNLINFDIIDTSIPVSMGVPAENGPVLEPNATMTIQEKFQLQNSDSPLFFYIRPVSPPATASPIPIPTCSICLTNPVNMIFMPCRHLCTCRDCNRSSANMILDCPVCRAIISHRELVFI
jgi:hypothetical protein